MSSTASPSETNRSTTRADRPSRRLAHSHVSRAAVPGATRRIRRWTTRAALPTTSVRAGRGDRPARLRGLAGAARGPVVAVLLRLLGVSDDDAGETDLHVAQDAQRAAACVLGRLVEL